MERKSVYDLGNIEFLCGNMFLICYNGGEDEDDDYSMSNVY